MLNKITEWHIWEVNPNDYLFRGDKFFPIFQQIIRQYCVYPQKSIQIEVGKFRYGFIFDWQNKDICEIEVYRKKIK